MLRRDREIAESGEAIEQFAPGEGAAVDKMLADLRASIMEMLGQARAEGGGTLQGSQLRIRATVGPLPRAVPPSDPPPAAA